MAEVSVSGGNLARVQGFEEREWRPDWLCPAGAILATHRRGRGDPTFGQQGRTTWRALHTPQGPATMQVEERTADGVVRAQAWGSGASWALEHLPDMLGACDDVTGFEPRLPELDRAWRRFGDHRFGRSHGVLQSLIPTIIEQKVTGQEAFSGYRRLVRGFGEPAPGPTDLWLPPSPQVVRGIASWEWLKLSIDPARSKAVIRACAVANSLERTAASGTAALDRALCSLPGIGRWSSAEVRSRVLGDPDAVSFGDYHIAKNVGIAMTGEPFDDDALAEFLQPWAGHRNRVVFLIQRHFGAPARRGPRMAPRTHLGRT